MKKIITIILSVLILLLASCTNEVEAPDCSWDEIFLQYWNAMNTEYVHFSDDTSYDWDKIYEEYLPKFKALDYTDAEDSIKAFKYFKEIAVNVYDNHYYLQVKDGLGNTLGTSPAMLRKYRAAGGDIMDYPDIIAVSSLGLGNQRVTVNNPDENVTDEEFNAIKKKSIDSIFEIKDLYDGAGDNVRFGYFHNPNGNIDDEFSHYYGYTFSTFSDEEKALYKKGSKEHYYVTIWNTIVEKISMESYFYGTTKDGIFYMYFSAFGNPLYLTDFLYKDESKLTEEEKKAITNDKSLDLLRGFTYDIVVNSQGKDASELDNDFQAIMKKGGDGIKGIKDMYDALNAAISDENVKGIVVDVRGNGGGTVAFLSAIWGSFFKNPTQFGYVRYKSGYSRYEYTPWAGFSITEDYVNEQLSTAQCEKPVALLVNGYSVSCSEVSCVIAKLLPNSKIIGHTTFGGTCALSDRTVFNGGPFQSEHLYIYTTTYQFKDMNGVSYELKGITPDIETELDPKSDNAYKKAKEWILSSN